MKQPASRRKKAASVEDAVAREVKAFEGSALAALALALAREIDKPGNSATSKAMCAQRLGDTLATLREMERERPVADRLDDLTARRTKRLAG